MSSARPTPPQRLLPGADVVISRPHRIATLLALGYGVIGILYILFSSQLAASLAVSKFELQQIEQMKGIGFVLLTTVLLFLLALGFLNRLAAREAEILGQRAVLLAAEKRAAAGLFAASVAHDINNVLTVSGLAVERLGGGAVLPAEQKSLVSTLQQTNARLRGLAHRLGLASGDDRQLVPESLDLSVLVLDTVDLARQHLKVKRCTIDTRIAPAIRLVGDASLLHRMVLNLLLNAADASRNHGRLLVSLAERADQVILEVQDDGPGVPESEREKIFEPLFTTKHDGSGLGLLSVRLCVRAHRGVVSVVPSELGGACFRVALPAGPR